MRKHKYGAVKTTVDGITFDSKLEASRYSELKLLERAGVITDLELQPRFLLQEPCMYFGKRVLKMEYVADFKYKNSDGQVIVEDAKGVRTEAYKLKCKLFYKRYPEILLVEV